MTMNEKTRKALQKRAKIELARKNFADFVDYTFPKFSWNWHHEVLAHELDQAAKFKKSHRKVIIVTPPRHGKALEVNTPILTPDKGFVRIVDLEPGDYVFGSDGKPTKVVAVSEVWKNRKIYPVSVNGGQDVIHADENHEWVVFNSKGDGTRVVETKDMAGRSSCYKVPRFGEFYSIRVYEGYNPYGVSPLTNNTVCIQVEAEDHLFLAGKSLIPTHNSELVSRRLPAFMLGKYPEMETIQWCYSGDLAEKMGRDCKKILDSPEFLEVFPEFEFGEKRTHSEMSTKQGGNYKTSGVDGGVTGRGANLVVVDDPFKNREEAESQSRRDKVWESFKDDLMTRIEYPYSVVVTMTRWHPDDLVGRLLKKEPGEWRVIHMPLIADYDQWDEAWPEWDPREPGQPLWPGVRLKGRIEGDEEFELPTEEELEEEIKREFEVNLASNPHGTNSLQQGRPTNKEGNLFKSDWMLRYNSPPEMMEPYCSSVVLSIDANFKKTNTGSAAALVVLGQRSDGKICILDAKWDRWSWVQLKKEAKKMAKKWPRATVVIEDKANGSALISELKEAGMVVVDYDPGKESKESRAQKLADVIESGAVFFPENASWVEPLIALLTGFPTAEFDDPVDAIAQAVYRWSTRLSAFAHLKRVLGKPFS